MRRFYWPDITGKHITVTGQEAKHISRVLRMQEGDMLILFDGSGIDYYCTLTGNDADSISVAVVEKKESGKELPVQITLCQAVIKSDHLDYAIQKCTEAGVRAFVPFLSERCVKRPDAKSAGKLVERESRIAMEAAKQCGRSYVPKVGDIVTLEKAAEELQNKNGLNLVAYESEEHRTIKEALREQRCREIFLFVGPEGGFTREEVRLLEEAGAVSCSLGELIFRSETAGLAAAAMIAYEYMGN